VLVRQAHPGGREPEYRDLEQKLADARAYQREEGIPWPVLVDDLEGTVHQAWGGQADPAYVLDRDGVVAFHASSTTPKALSGALEDLLAQEGRGVVWGGVRRRPELGPMLTDGWRGLRRGLPRSALDLMVAAPLAPVALFLGHVLRPVLAPITLRDRPLVRRRTAARAGALLGVAAGLLAVGLITQRALRA
jgi:hypothetical protein